MDLSFVWQLSEALEQSSANSRKENREKACAVSAEERLFSRQSIPRYSKEIFSPFSSE
jgi:hypothetical protein